MLSNHSGRYLTKYRGQVKIKILLNYSQTCERLKMAMYFLMETLSRFSVLLGIVKTANSLFLQGGLRFPMTPMSFPAKTQLLCDARHGLFSVRRVLANKPSQILTVRKSLNLRVFYQFTQKGEKEEHYR